MMAAFSTLTVMDIVGAAKQFEAYATDTLGFDARVEAKVSPTGKGFEILVVGYDRFQDKARYEDRVGQLFVAEAGKLDTDFDEVCRLVWDKLEKAMKRDERELRAGLRVMGGVIEQSESFNSHVGKMFAERIRTARDEATNYMIEHHGWKAA